MVDECFSERHLQARFALSSVYSMTSSPPLHPSWAMRTFPNDLNVSFGGFIGSHSGSEGRGPELKGHAVSVATEKCPEGDTKTEKAELVPSFGAIIVIVALRCNEALESSVTDPAVELCAIGRRQ
jgi:hypothetical protein